MPGRVSHVRINQCGELPGGPVVIGLHAFTTEALGSIPDRGTKIPQATWHSQKKRLIRVLECGHPLNYKDLLQLLIKWCKQSLMSTRIISLRVTKL